MRRKDREVTGTDEIISIIRKCDVCRIAFSDSDIPYIVPMNFGYQCSDEGFVLYFHCADKGKKIDIMNKNANVCFEMDCSQGLVTGDMACNYSFNFESIIGNGCICAITDKVEKLYALNLIMKKYSNNSEPKNNGAKNSDPKNGEFIYNDKLVETVTCLKLMVKDYSCKRLIRV